MQCIKLTDHNRNTYNGMLWTPGEWHVAELGPVELCSLTALHAYPTLEVARLCHLLHNLHIRWPKIRAWEAECDGEIQTDGIKIGAKRMRILREVPWVPLSSEQYVHWAIVCAWGGAAPSWREWALGWLRGEDRSRLAGGLSWAMWGTWVATSSANLSELLQIVSAETCAETADRLERNS